MSDFVSANPHVPLPSPVICLLSPNGISVSSISVLTSIYIEVTVFILEKLCNYCQVKINHIFSSILCIHHELLFAFYIHIIFLEIELIVRKALYGTFVM